MVIKIHQVANTENAFRYNEKKVKEGVAVFFQSKNTLSVNPFMYDENHRLKNLLDIEKLNPRVKNKCLHISFNPSTEDYLKLGDKFIRQEIDNMMQHMGYGNQPYFVYKHKDLERVHFHIVSTRIDQQTGKKIKDNYERQKMQKFIQKLEEKYQLTQKETPESPNFKFSAKSRNYKQNLENLFKHLNGLNEITSKEMYDQALKIFNVEIKKSGRGHVVLVCDENGNPIRYPIRLSNFKEKPRFYLSENKEITLGKIEKEYRQEQKPTFDKFRLAQLARDLNRLVERSQQSKTKNKTNQIQKQKKYRKRW